MKKFKDIKPLIIGAGVAGKRHLETQINQGFLTGVYTRSPQKVELLRNNKNIIVFDNVEAGLDWSNLVHICTPDDKHTEFVAMAAKRGKTVLCEKAFTTSFSDALYLQKLAHQNNSVIIVGQNYRLTPTFQESRKKILAGELGKLTKIKTTYLHDKNDFHKRKYRDENFLFTGGSHAVDLAYWIVGEQLEVLNVYSKSIFSHQVTVRFKSGILGNIKLDSSSERTISGTDLIVYGEKGKLVSHNKIDQLLFYKKGYKKPISIPLPNLKTLTVPLEIKIVDDYLLGKVATHWPLPAVDEAIHVIKVLENIKKAAL
jgi:predicted dehydrogenase